MLYDIITFDERIKGLPPKDQFDTDNVFTTEYESYSQREFEVDQLGEMYLLLNYGKDKIQACTSNGLIVKDEDDNQFYCVFDSGFLQSISRIDYVLLYKKQNEFNSGVK